MPTLAVFPSLAALSKLDSADNLALLTRKLPNNSSGELWMESSGIPSLNGFLGYDVKAAVELVLKIFKEKATEFYNNHNGNVHSLDFQREINQYRVEINMRTHSNDIDDDDPNIFSGDDYDNDTGEKVRVSFYKTNFLRVFLTTNP